MSKQDTSLNPKIVESAKKEFLEKGFPDATLRNIARNAGVTTGAIYKRYKGKEELFEEVVQPALDLLDTVMLEDYNHYNEEKEKQESDELFGSTLEFTQKIIRLMFKEKEALKLLFGKAEGTKYSNFLYDFTKKTSKESFKLIKEERKKGFLEATINLEELHILVISQWSVFAEIFIRGFTLKQALSFIEKFDKFFNWKAVMKLTK